MGTAFETSGFFHQLKDLKVRNFQVEAMKTLGRFLETINGSHVPWWIGGGYTYRWHGCWVIPCTKRSVFSHWPQGNHRPSTSPTMLEWRADNDPDLRTTVGGSIMTRCPTHTQEAHGFSFTPRMIDQKIIWIALVIGGQVISIVHLYTLSTTPHCVKAWRQDFKKNCMYIPLSSS